ncbi:MAG: hypothetical protein WBG76_12070 [Ornithinimicrobium sp.]
MSAEQDDEFTAFVDRASPQLLAQAWMLTGDPETAQDLVNKALVRVHHRWSRVRGHDPTAYTAGLVSTLHASPPRALRRHRAAADLPGEAHDDRQDPRNDAAIGPPQMAVASSDVLAIAYAERRSRRARAGGMALAAVVLAAVAWVGLGGGIDDIRTDDVQRAERIEWDATVDFETRLTTDNGLHTPWFGTNTVQRVAGGENFSVELWRDGDNQRLESIEGDLPEGVSVFTYGGRSLVVSEELYQAPAVLDVSGPDGPAGKLGTRLTDDEAAIHVWSVESVLRPSQVSDIYWLLPSEVVTSTGDKVLNEVIAAGDAEIEIYIVESTGRWAPRSGEFKYWLRTAGAPEALTLEDDLIFTVLPSSFRSPEFVVMGDAYDSENRLEQTTRRLQPTVFIRGQYQLLWAEIDNSEFIPGGFAIADWDDAPPSWFNPGAIEAQETSDGGFELSYPGTASSLRVAKGRRDTQAVLGEDGSALAVTAWPTDLGGEDDPPGVRGLDATLVFDDGNQLVAGNGGPSDVVTADPLLIKSKLVAVGVVPGTFSSPGMQILPTVLFNTGDGPRWAGRSAPLSYELDNGAQITASIDGGIGVWAAAGDYAGQGVGRIGTTQVAYVESVDRTEDPPAPTLYYAVLVLPSDVAATAVPIINGPGIDLDRVIVGKPAAVEIGDGLSLWAVSLNRPPGAGIDALDEALVGVDLDADGIPD